MFFITISVLFFVTTLVTITIHLYHHFVCAPKNRSRSDSIAGNVALALKTNPNVSCDERCSDACELLFCLRTAPAIGGAFPWMFLIFAITLLFISGTLTVFYAVLDDGKSMFISGLSQIGWILICGLEISFSIIRRQVSLDLRETMRTDKSVWAAKWHVSAVWLFLIVLFGGDFIVTVIGPYSGGVLKTDACTVRATRIGMSVYLLFHGVVVAYCAVIFYQVMDQTYRQTLQFVAEDMYADEIRPIVINAVLSVVSGCLITPLFGLVYLWAPCFVYWPNDYILLIICFWLNGNLFFLCFGENRRSIAACLSCLNCHEKLMAAIQESKVVKDDTARSECTLTIVNPVTPINPKLHLDRPALEPIASGEEVPPKKGELEALSPQLPGSSPGGDSSFEFIDDVLRFLPPKVPGGRERTASLTQTLSTRPMGSMMSREETVLKIQEIQHCEYAMNSMETIASLGLTRHKPNLCQRCRTLFET